MSFSENNRGVGLKGKFNIDKKASLCDFKSEIPFCHLPILLILICNSVFYCIHL